MIADYEIQKPRDSGRLFAYANIPRLRNSGQSLQTGQIIVEVKATSVYGLSLIVSFFVFVSSLSLFVVFGKRAAQAQSFCLPVVYAFRHAEDVNTPLPPHLTDVGTAHARLYPEMVANFGQLHNYCPVGHVYANYNIKPNKGIGTENPYQTAAPLALYACGQRGTTPSDCNQNLDAWSYPLMTVEKYAPNRLYEYLGKQDAEMGNPAAGKSVVSGELNTQLQDNSFTDLSRNGLSSAIFWTSQGLNVLGQAIVPGFTDIPGCTEPPPAGMECQKPKPPRNAVYIFESRPNLQGFNPPTNVSQYLQCFNIKPPSGVPGGSTYYCDRSGSLPQQIEDTTKLRGKICDTTNLGTDCKMIN